MSLRKTCLVCKKEFLTYPSLKQKLCSRGCSNQYKKGFHPSEETRRKISETSRGRHNHWSEESKRRIRGPLNPGWKGDLASKKYIHIWFRRNYPIPERCQICGKKKPLDLANISQEYKRDISDWEWLCRKCHMEKDGRMIKLRKAQTRWLSGYKQYLKTQVDGKEVAAL